MPDVPAKDLELGKLEYGSEGDQEKTPGQLLEIARDELPESGGDQDERPPTADEIAEVHPSHLVKQEEHTEQDEDEAPENASRRVSL